MFLEEAIARDFVGDKLIEGRGMKIRALFELREFPDDFGRSDDPAQAKPRSERLGKSAEVNDIAGGIGAVAGQALAVEREQGSEVVALIAQFAVGIILDNRNAVPLGEGNEFDAAVFGQGGSGGILKVGKHVHEFGIGTQRFLQQLGAQAVVIDRNRHEVRGKYSESLQSAQISWRLDEHAISRIDQQFAEQIERLLRTGCDQHIVRAGLDSMACNLVGNELAQGRVSLGFAVLQGRSRVLRKHLVTGFLKALGRK